MQYSDTVMEHFKSPHNVGTMENPDGVGQVGNPVCGDMMKIMIKVKEDKIDDIKFETFGCGAAIAVSSMVTDMAKGKTLEEAMQITNKSVAEQLGGLPKNKMHCSNLGADALQKAIQDYFDRKEGRVRKRPDEGLERLDSHEKHCYCPYCDFDQPEEAPFCVRCGKPTVEHDHD
jgi:nitrogen fixation protein NifU and related proteins